MSSLLEKSLDDIIGSSSGSGSGSRSGHPNRNRKNFNNRGRGGRGGRGRNSRISKPGRTSGYKSRTFDSLPPMNGKPTEIKITNLHPELTTEDLTKLMETIGPTKNVEIKYNTHGKSIGIAFVEFEYGKDATTAIHKFDGRLAAGQTIRVTSTVPLSARLSGPVNSAVSKRKNAPKPKKKNKTLEDLDNELSTYMNGNVESEDKEGAAAPVDAPADAPTEPSIVEGAAPPSETLETNPADTATDEVMEQ